MTAPEFSRSVRLDRIGERPSGQVIEADEGERAALAERFGLIAIERLAAEIALSRQGETVRAEGTLRAEVTQACVATGDPVPAEIDTEIAVRFIPEAADPAEEVELDIEALDTVDYTGGAIDLGEAAAETLALALDPFPRSPRAEAALAEAGVLTEEQAREASGPFAALAALKKSEDKA